MDVLTQILRSKADEVARSKKRLPDAELVDRIRDLPPVRPFRSALEGRAGVSLIAEIKRASPSKGSFAPDLDAARMAQIYESSGASAISVLTDEPFFGGSLIDLEAASAACSLPLLRKEFVIDPYQVREARLHGAAAILLIVRALEPGPFEEILGTAHDLGMEALVEVHDESELERLAGTEVRIVGINNRDLKTFQTDLGTSIRLSSLLPEQIVRVAESGIRNARDVERLAAARFDAILVGEAIVTSSDPTATIEELVGRAGS